MPAAVPGHRALNWLAMSAACLLGLVVTLHQTAVGIGGQARSPGDLPMMAITLSNLSVATYLPGSFSTEQNSIPADTFKPRRIARAERHTPSFLLPRTNGMYQ